MGFGEKPPISRRRAPRKQQVPASAVVGELVWRRLLPGGYISWKKGFKNYPLN